MTDDNAQPRIQFRQHTADVFTAVFYNGVDYMTAAIIRQLDGDWGTDKKAHYRITYYRTPSMRKTLPVKTHRTVFATYETIQNRIIARGV
jgi:hypothetical protein